ncbi:MAG: OmpA family protein [Gemmatimonadetes bacterium]|nr:OmpA family protein [Gemmatimonadota bacterium]
MSFLRPLALACAALAAAPLPAAAQRAGAIELGAFGRYNLYADTLQLQPAFGGGGRMGYFFRRNWAVEGEVAWAEPSVRGAAPGDSLGHVAHPLFSYRVTYNRPIDNRASLMVGAGYAYDSYQRLRTVAPRGGGPTALLGVRFRITDYVAARFEGTGTYVVASDRSTGLAPVPRHFNVGAHAGISVMAFARAPKPVVRTEIVKEIQRDTIYITRIDTVVIKAPAGRPVVVGAVNFGFNGKALSLEAKRILDLIAESLLDATNLTRTVAVTGSTDAVGSERYNLTLGQVRADQVKAYLVSKGVATERIQARTQGERDPVAPNASADGRATNRRVLIILTN